MKYAFRNNAQQQAFSEWWNGHMKQYFKEQADKLETDETAMWVIGIAYQEGIEKMARIVQDALQLATTATVNP